MPEACEGSGPATAGPFHSQRVPDGTVSIEMPARDRKIDLLRGKLTAPWIVGVKLTCRPHQFRNISGRPVPGLRHSSLIGKGDLGIGTMADAPLPA